MTFTHTGCLDITQAARHLRIKSGTLRMWEMRLGWPNPPRTNGGHRIYPPAMIEMLERVVDRWRSGIPISDLIRGGMPHVPPPVESTLVESLRAEIAEMVEVLALPPEIRYTAEGAARCEHAIGRCTGGRAILDEMARLRGIISERRPYSEAPVAKAMEVRADEVAELRSTVTAAKAETRAANLRAETLAHKLDQVQRAYHHEMENERPRLLRLLRRAQTKADKLARRRSDAE